MKKIILILSLFIGCLLNAQNVTIGTIGIKLYSGTVNPNGVIIGNAGDEYFMRGAGNIGTLYKKKTGMSTNTGWVELADVTQVGTNYWTSSGSNIYSNNSGNVGIGTTAPALKLQVDGTFGAIRTINGSTTSAYVLNDYASLTANGSLGGAANISVDTLGNTNIGGSGICTISSYFAITDGTQGAGKLLVSDSVGNATWRYTVDVPLGPDITGGFSLDDVAGEILSFVINSNTGEGAGVISKDNAGDLECEMSWTGDGVTNSNRVRTTKDGIILNSYDGVNNRTVQLDATDFTIDIPSKGAGKVLTSDASGVATWNLPVLYNSGGQIVDDGTLGSYANDAAAAAGGVNVGSYYINSVTGALTKRLI